MAAPSLARAAAVTLDAKVAFLRQPSSFAHGVDRVEAIETHMSWVFLAGAYAYKLKKPVRRAWFDFRSVAARRHFCEEELRLNRRLAAEVYLDLLPLSLDLLGHLQLSAHGQVVDWLVRMRRLQARHMLDFKLRHGTASATDMRRVASRLASFYATCPPLPTTPEAYCRQFQHSIERNVRRLSRPAYRLPLTEVATLCADQQAFVRAHGALFAQRVQAGKVVEGHGDLRPEHVCLAPRLWVIDCLEFSATLRSVDPADELGYLALECERLQAKGPAKLLLPYYTELTGDQPPATLVHFYQAYRAVMRAGIAIRHLDEPQFVHSAEWRSRALAYLRLARQHQLCMSADTERPA